MPVRLGANRRGECSGPGGPQVCAGWAYAGILRSGVLVQPFLQGVVHARLPARARGSEGSDHIRVQAQAYLHFALAGRGAAPTRRPRRKMV